jgi:hypothetical protein
MMVSSATLRASTFARARHFEGAKLAKSLVPPKRFGKCRPEVSRQLRASIHRKFVEVRLAAQV